MGLCIHGEEVKGWSCYRFNFDVGKSSGSLLSSCCDHHHSCIVDFCFFLLKSCMDMMTNMLVMKTRILTGVNMWLANEYWWISSCCVPTYASFLAYVVVLLSNMENINLIGFIVSCFLHYVANRYEDSWFYYVASKPEISMLTVNAIMLLLIDTSPKIRQTSSCYLQIPRRVQFFCFWMA